MSIRHQTLIHLALLTSAVVFAAGCSRPNAPAPQTGKQAAPTGSADPMAEGKDDAHSGWWCAEHGIPEAVCSLCDAQVAAAFQKKGDWCVDHDRAKSQCFVCEPSLKEKFAAQYRAKEGKDPPPMEEEAPAKDGKKS